MRALLRCPVYITLNKPIRLVVPDMRPTWDAIRVVGLEGQIQYEDDGLAHVAVDGIVPHPDDDPPNEPPTLNRRCFNGAVVLRTDNISSISCVHAADRQIVVGGYIVRGVTGAARDRGIQLLQEHRAEGAVDDELLAQTIAKEVSARDIVGLPQLLWDADDSEYQLMWSVCRPGYIRELRHHDDLTTTQEDMALRWGNTIADAFLRDRVDPWNEDAVASLALSEM